MKPPWALTFQFFVCLELGSQNEIDKHKVDYFAKKKVPTNDSLLTNTQ